MLTILTYFRNQANLNILQPVLADAVVAHLEPIQKKYAEVTADPSYLDAVLRDGQEAADELAEKTLRYVDKKYIYIGNVFH